MKEWEIPTLHATLTLYHRIMNFNTFFENFLSFINIKVIPWYNE